MNISKFKRGGIHQEMLRRGRGKNPVVPGFKDLLNWLYYDTYTASASASTATEITFFSTPQSATKSKVDTNLKRPYQLDSFTWMNVTHLGLDFHGNMSLTDIHEFQQKYWLELWIGNKCYFEGPPRFVPAGVGNTGVTTATSTTTWTHGEPKAPPAGMLDLRIPAGLGDPPSNGLMGIALLETEQFYVLLKGTAFTLAANARVQVSIYGQASKTVQ